MLKVTKLIPAFLLLAVSSVSASSMLYDLFGQYHGGKSFLQQHATDTQRLEQNDQPYPGIVKLDRELPRYKVDLSQPPELRFKEPNTYMKDISAKTIRDYASLFPTFIEPIFQYLDWVIQWYSHDRFAELEGIASDLGLSRHMVLMVSYSLEFSSFCTSLIARMANNEIIHLRTLDFGFPDDMKYNMYIGEYYNGEEYLFEAVMFGGTNSVATGVKNGSFSISVNQRAPSGDKDMIEFYKNAALIFIEQEQTTWIVRDVLTQCADYQCALQKLTTVPVISPVYLILAGVNPNEGAVISRDRQGPANVTTLSNETWYIIQTNSDHFKGIYGVRYEAAMSNLEKIGQQHITVDRAHKDVILQYPNVNSMTIHSSVMSPASGYSLHELVASVNQTVPDDL